MNIDSTKQILDVHQKKSQEGLYGKGDKQEQFVTGNNLGK